MGDWLEFDESHMSKNLNLVFQGGGIRGIAYAGVLQQLPPEYRIRGVGGTSVGALIAAFLATGATPADMEALVRDPKLKALLLKAEVERFERLRRMWSDLYPLASSVSRGKVPVFSGAMTLWRHRAALADLGMVWDEKGLFGLDELRRWLYEKIGRIKFNDPSLKIRDLKIVAADVSRQEYTVFDGRHGGTELVEAVCASVAIPIFFRPALWSNSRHFVDGGLLSNFPTFLFSTSEWPTLGFRLRDVVSPSDMSPANYLKGLLLTATEAHDKLRGKGPRFKEVEVAVPATISSVGFSGLTDEQVTQLFEAGQSTRVDWGAVAADLPQDPLPERAPEVLSLALKSGSRLLERCADASMFADHLHQSLEMTVTIEPDWSVQYDKVSTLVVTGRGTVVALPFKFQRTEGAVDPTLFDLHAGFEEVGSPAQPILFPAEIKGIERGFAALLVPSVAEGQPERKFHSWFTVSKEFETSLGEGRPDVVRCITVQQATTHSVELVLRVRVDATLRSLEVVPTFACRAHSSVLTDGNRKLHQYEFAVQAGPVNTRTVHTVSLRPT